VHNYAVLVTGGAGFIGSHLTERLLREGHKVTILDNFSSAVLENIEPFIDNPSLTVVKDDLKEPLELDHIVERCRIIYHLAANPEVRLGETDPKVHFEENILTTFNLLEAIRQSGAPKIIVFASTSTIYGEASQIPTTEHYAPLIPISTYGASKLASEALITSYAYTYNHRVLILRLANIVGPKSNHGVIVDFIKKISQNQRELEILGDGSQEKSYLYITDCVDAIIHLTNEFCRNGERVSVYNIGSHDKTSVREIARIVAQEMNTRDIKFQFTGGVNGGRGWKGDVKTMQLSINRLLKTGWKPMYTSQQAVRMTARSLIEKASCA
jgi:UDP-glucose 4-epimerase